MWLLIVFTYLVLNGGVWCNVLQCSIMFQSGGLEVLEKIGMFQSSF